MSQAERIIGKFGGPTALAKLLGHKYPTTVHGWKRSGFIPSPHHQAVLDAAKRAEPAVDLVPADFFDGAEAQTEPTAGAPEAA